GGNPAFLTEASAFSKFLLATSSVGCAASFPSRGSLCPAKSTGAEYKMVFFDKLKKPQNEVCGFRISLGIRGTCPAPAPPEAFSLPWGDR
ncbi:MAG: hypothetical protein ACI3VD_10110, partial [Candidatus Limivicinus sp.]